MNDNIYRLVVSFILVGQSLKGEGVSLTAIVFLIPAILFSGYAGYLADRMAKRLVLILTKAFEIVSMILAYFALGTEYTFLMLAVLFTLATQAAFSLLPNIRLFLSWFIIKNFHFANALLEMTTYVAIIVGSALAGILMQLFNDETQVISIFMIAVAVIGN